jgi:hypothetical protein
LVFAELGKDLVVSPSHDLINVAFVEMEYLDDEILPSLKKERHGCLTAWLILMLIGNAFSAITLLLFKEQLKLSAAIDPSNWTFSILFLLSLANLGFAVLLFKYRKLGFWGFLASSLLAFAFNLHLGQGLLQSGIGLVGIILLYGLLQIPKNNKTGWEHLS